ncbi:PREDICTED: nucleolar protein 14-like [Amphimedon queenslandica]|uniref:Nucleolar protein 14 n=1 Tax=Amphimedon queenslandica TaxID=400682 RepID=A0AAN0J562_AMPQE|nr:PREDICTED: nucleolar protein 14-like [Amphimedon queenslandica]|eukprot:XP_019851848.1 PREDICTED: nucleolar protein 14-like [Amphimedon queenslandica]
MGKKRLKEVKKRSKSTQAKVNPFEVRINKRKYSVLGQRREKGEKGLPGISRSRALEKRKKTLLRDYQERDKTNQLLDRRFGTDDVPEEERELQRFLLETKRRHKRGSIFNLEEDEEEGLTHYGQSLGDHVNDIVFDDEEQLDEFDATENHFGGFLKKKDTQQPTDGNEESGRTRKQIMREVAAKSKLHKYERQVEREKVEDMLDQLNSDWNDIRSLLNHSSKAAPPTSANEDDYDRYLVELSREPRGQAKDRLKTDEELAQEEKVRLERLEQERLKRMSGAASITQEHQHISADDDTRAMAKEDDRVMLQYDDGQLVLPKGMTSLLPDREEEEDIEEEEEEEEGEGEGSNEEFDEDEQENENNDIDSLGEEEEDPMNDVSDDMKDPVSSNNDIPFAFKNVPSKVSELVSLLQDRTPSECGTIVQRIISCHHHVLSMENKDRMKSFLRVLLEYCLHHTRHNPLILNELVQYIYELAKIDTKYTVKSFQRQLKLCYKQHCTANFPSLSDIILFKLIAAVFPTSDYQHPVVTPSLHLMCTSLTKTTVCNTIGNVIGSICLCKLILEYVSVSKRYIPELANYLCNLLLCFSSENVVPLTHPFSVKLKESLSLYSYSKEEEGIDILNAELLRYRSIDELSLDQVKLSLLKLTLECLNTVSQYWYNSPSFDAIFQTTLNTIKSLDVPKSLKSLLEQVQASIESGISRPKPILQVLRRKPKSVKFFEPQFDNDYQPGRRKAPNKTQGEMMKLKHKHKRELKGAIREIRKDTKFLARQKLKEQLTRDGERKRKVKQIEGWLQEQQHDMKMEKIRKRK